MHSNHTFGRLFLATLGWTGIFIGIGGWIGLLAIFMGVE